MTRTNSIRRNGAMSLVLAGAAFTLLCTSAVNPARAGKPEGGSSPPIDTGTVYYTAAGGTRS